MPLSASDERGSSTPFPALRADEPPPNRVERGILAVAADRGEHRGQEMVDR
jgi:hypothetical protein